MRLTIPNGGGLRLDGVILPDNAVITDGVANVAGTQNTDVMSRYDFYANPEGWTLSELHMRCMFMTPHLLS